MTIAGQSKFLFSKRAPTYLIICLAAWAMIFLTGPNLAGGNLDAESRLTKAQLAKLLFWRGQNQEALEIFAQLEFAKMPAEERLAYINLSMAMGDIDQAVALSWSHLEISPDDNPARLKLAEMLLWSSNFAEGKAQLQILEKISFNPDQVQLALGQAHFWSGNPHEALKHLNSALNYEMATAELFSTRGEVHMALASFTQAIFDFDKAIEELTDHNEKALASSDVNSLINKIQKNKALCHSYLGNNATAEILLAEFNSKFPTQADVIIELSRVLRKNHKLSAALNLLKNSMAQLPENALIIMELGDCHIETGHWHKTRDYYQQAMQITDHVDPDTELRWANRLTQIRNFPQAAGIIAQHLENNENSDNLKIDLAWTKASMERYEEATGMLQQIIHNNPGNQQAITTLVKVKILEKKYAEAKALTNELMIGGHDHSQVAELLNEATAAKNHAEVDYRDSRHELILELEKKVFADPDNFPLNFELIQELANQRDYDYALCLLHDLLCLYPDHYAASLMQARVQGWSGAFCCSLSSYEKLVLNDPENPVYYREAGRTAFWANEIEQATCWYNQMLMNPVSELLYDKIHHIALTEILIASATKDLIRTSRTPAFEKYEQFSNRFAHVKEQLELYIAEHVAASMLELHATYLLQRNFYLEYLGKKLNKRQKPRRALKSFNQLFETEPANLEVLFDKSQTMCSLGLLDHERSTYETVLAYAPGHNLIRDTLKKLDDDERPLLRFRYYNHHEKGRGSLARMRMHGSRLEAAAYINQRWKATVAGGSRYFRPGIWQGRFRSLDSELMLNGVLSAYTRLNAGINHNSFANNRELNQLTPKSTTTGFINLSHSVADSLNLTLGFARDNLYSNDIALRDGITLDNLHFGVEWPASRKLMLGASIEHGRYSDSNRLKVLKYQARYDLTEFPEIFRLILSGERRHTRNLSKYAFLNGTLIDIKHPYWTPQHYSGHNLALQYYRDLSTTRICRADKHYFSLIFSVGDDSLANHGRRLDWQWHLDWQNRWESGISGYWHDSPDWKSSRFDFYLGYKI